MTWHLIRADAVTLNEAISENYNNQKTPKNGAFDTIRLNVIQIAPANPFLFFSPFIQIFLQFTLQPLKMDRYITAKRGVR